MKYILFLIFILIAVNSFADEEAWIALGGSNITHGSESDCIDAEAPKICVDPRLFPRAYSEIDGFGNPKINQGLKTAFEAQEVARAQRRIDAASALGRLRTHNCNAETGIVKDLCLIYQ